VAPGILGERNRVSRKGGGSGGSENAVGELGTVLNEAMGEGEGQKGVLDQKGRSVDRTVTPIRVI